MTDIVTEATETLTRKHAQRLEYELHGAWRAGYNYLHVYSTITDDYSHRTAVLPTHTRLRPASVGDYTYDCTYDLTGIDAAEVRRRLWSV